MHTLDTAVLSPGRTTLASLGRFAVLAAFLLGFGDAVAATPTGGTVDIHECEGAQADADHAAIHADGAAHRILSELIAVKKLHVDHADRITDVHAVINLSCVPVVDLVSMLADVSGAMAKRDANGSFRILAVNNGAAIHQLRAEANKYAAAGDTAKAHQTLLRIVALSKPGTKDDVQADVNEEYHELGNTALAAKDYIHAEQYYRARLVQMEREGDTQSANYAIAVSNVADAREYQDDFAGATKLYEHALALMESHPGPLTLPNSVMILGTLADNALSAKRYDEAEAYDERAWNHLNDPHRSQWDSVDKVVEFAATLELEMARLGTQVNTDKHYQRALKLKQDRYGMDSMETVALRDRLILTSQLAGQIDRAEDYAQQQLAAADKRGDRSSGEYVGAMYQLLAIYAHQGKLDQLLALWQRMLSTRQALLGATSPEVVAALHDLATLYRLNRQWSQAATADERATAIKPVEHSAAVVKFEPTTPSAQYAMKYDPGLSVLCARILIQAKPLADTLIPPEPPLAPFVLVDPAGVKPEPLPKDALAQARLLEQEAECTVDEPTFATHELERALHIRIDTQGDQHADTRATARRLVELYEKSGNAQGANRIRALIRDF